jgi:pimeloyl-ACP methyl ester carboxylesterase
LLLIAPVIEPEMADRDLPALTVLARDEAFMATLSPEQAAQFTPIAVVQDRYNWERFATEVWPGLQLADSALFQRVKEKYRFSFPLESAPFAEPTLLVMGRQDNLVGYRDQWRILEHYPRASFVVLDRAGHNLQTEQAQLFTALVSEWLDRVAERS